MDMGFGTAITTPEPQVSIVIPTLNEVGNMWPLLERIDVALKGTNYEVIVVDDGSEDGTAELCNRLAAKYPVSVHVRASPTGGLSGAVVEGFRHARGELLVVMDADLQHPPEQLPALIAPIVCNKAEFVIGSRYIHGAEISEGWGLWRRLSSYLAVILSKPLVGSVRDPMSGFFAINRCVYDRARDLHPMGYKIALELLYKCRIRSVFEIPINFRTREYGESKLSIRQRLRFGQHLINLYLLVARGLISECRARLIQSGWGLAGFGVFVELLSNAVDGIDQAATALMPSTNRIP
jgi:dolichol-phosphate mannosyltransferase